MTNVKARALDDIGAASYFIPDAVKDGFEKSTALCNEIQELGKRIGAAYLESATIASAGAQSISSENYTFSRKIISDIIETAKTALATKSVHELLALQSKVTKSTFDGYAAQTKKIMELYLSAATNSLAPLKPQAKAAGEFDN